MMWGYERRWGLLRPSRWGFEWATPFEYWHRYRIGPVWWLIFRQYEPPPEGDDDADVP